MKQTLFIGDINVDIIMGGMVSQPIVDKEITCESYDVVVGSSAAIAACAHASLGGATAFLGLAGDDDHGRFMTDSLGAYGIDTKRIRTAADVRTGVTINLIHKSTRTQVTYPGTISAFDGATVTAGDLAGVGHVHFAGPYQQTKFRPHITRILKLAREAGITSSLDPQWDATERWELMDEWLPLLDYLFVNEGEAVSIARGGSPEDAAQKLAGKTRRAIVKLGPLGAVCYVDGKPVRAGGYSVNISDTTGAGDSFDAAFLFATLGKKLPLEEALRLGNAVGARSCTFAGGVAHRTTYADAQRMMGQS